MQPCGNTRLADTHEANSEPANEEIEQYQVPETCNTAGSRPQRIRRAPVRMTYDVPGQPAYYPAVTTNLHTALVAPNPVPAWFGMTPPYQPVWYWPQCTVPFQPIYSPRGVLEVYMTGGPTYFLGLKIYTLGIFLGQEICHVFF